MYRQQQYANDMGLTESDYRALSNMLNMTKDGRFDGKMKNNRGEDDDDYYYDEENQSSSCCCNPCCMCKCLTKGIFSIICLPIKNCFSTLLCFFLLVAVIFVAMSPVWANL
jgi:hypothetical protein